MEKLGQKKGANMPRPEEMGGIGTNAACDQLRPPYQPTKKRAVELTQLGLKVYDFMNEIGIKKSEYCHFGNVMQTLLSLPD